MLVGTAASVQGEGGVRFQQTQQQPSPEGPPRSGRTCLPGAAWLGCWSRGPVRPSEGRGVRHFPAALRSHEPLLWGAQPAADPDLRCAGWPPAQRAALQCGD